MHFIAAVFQLAQRQNALAFVHDFRPFNLVFGNFIGGFGHFYIGTVDADFAARYADFVACLLQADAQVVAFGRNLPFQLLYFVLIGPP